MVISILNHSILISCTDYTKCYQNKVLQVYICTSLFVLLPSEIPHRIFILVVQNLSIPKIPHAHNYPPHAEAMSPTARKNYIKDRTQVAAIYITEYSNTRLWELENKVEGLFLYRDANVYQCFFHVKIHCSFTDIIFC